MIANIDKVIEWLEVNETPHFVVSSKEGENSKIFESREDESFEDAKNRLRRVMEFCHGNRFLIKARKDYKGTRGMFTEEFRNNPDGVQLSPGQSAVSGTPQSVNPGLGFISIGELDRRLSEERKSILQDVKIERLEAENKELQTELLGKDTAFTRTIQKIEPYLGTILGNTIGKMVPQAPMVGVAGLSNDSDISDQTVLSDEDRLSNALQRWSAVEPDMIRIIETLAGMAVNGDSMYSMAKNMLIK